MQQHNLKVTYIQLFVKLIEFLKLSRTKEYFFPEIVHYHSHQLLITLLVHLEDYAVVCSNTEHMVYLSCFWRDKSPGLHVGGHRYKV